MKYLRVQCSQWNKPTRCFFTIITTKLPFCEPDIRENHPIYAKYRTLKRVLADIDRLRRWLSWKKLQWFNPSKSILKGVFPSDRAVDFLYKRWNPSKSTIKGVFHWIAKRKNLRAENASVKIQYTQNQCLTLFKVNEFCTVFGNLHFLIYLLDINASS